MGGIFKAYDIRGSYQGLSILDEYIDKVSAFVHNPRSLKMVVDAVKLRSE